MKKRSGGPVAGLIIIIVCIIGLIFAGNLSSSLLKTIITILVIAVLAAVVIVFLIIFLARRSGQQSAAAGPSSTAPVLTPEQVKSLDQARSQLVNARMIISRMKDPQLSQSGLEACSSMEKVLQTLRQKPEKIQTTRQLFNYYIPTFEKVVTRYQRIESGEVDQEQVPEKLENYFSNVKDAMANLYEGLFDNDKLNMTVDMEAMTIAIKRDGLLDEEDFEVTPSGEIPDIRQETARQ